jgi:ribosomal protein S18 acetylase RimI-like enzyme
MSNRVRTKRAELSDLPMVAQAACRDLSPQRAGLVVSIMRDLVDQKATDKIRLYFDASSAETSGVVAITNSDESATILAAGPSANEAQISHTCRLLGIAHDELAGEGIRFVQATRDTDGAPSWLSRAGYQHLAVLDYLAAETHTVILRHHGWQQHAKSESTNRRETLDFVPFEDFFQAPNPPQPPSPRGESSIAFDRLDAFVAQTYDGSLDCPRIADFRTSSDALRGYRRSADHDPRLWLIAVLQGDPVGCLLLTPSPGAGTLEVTYMGAPPRQRGQGVGMRLLGHSAEIASRRGLSHLTLGVDRENYPAHRLYQRAGFEPLLSESVWGQNIR